MTADYRCRTRDPANPSEGSVDAIFLADWYLKLYKTDPVGYQNLRAAKYVLENVERVFRGLRWYDSSGGSCFVARPNSWHIREGVVVPFPEALVFAVYLNPRLQVFDVRAERCANDDPKSPVDWQNRYEVLASKKSTS